MDTNEPFYVGKGKEDRWKCLKRNNKYFNNIVSKYEVCVNIIHDNLDEETAFNYEWLYIEEYRDMGYTLTNIADGGSGGIHLYGKNNPMHGRTWWDENTPKEKISNWKRKVANNGELNGMYNHTYSKETINKMKNAKQGKFIGKNNPNYNNNTLKLKLEKNPELKKQYYSRIGKQNGMSKYVIVIDEDGNEINKFDCIKFCAEWLLANNMCRSKNIKAISDNITMAFKNNKKAYGFFYKIFK